MPSRRSSRPRSRCGTNAEQMNWLMRTRRAVLPRSANRCMQATLRTPGAPAEGPTGPSPPEEGGPPAAALCACLACPAGDAPAAHITRPVQRTGAGSGLAAPSATSRARMRAACRRRCSARRRSVSTCAGSVPRCARDSSTTAVSRCSAIRRSSAAVSGEGSGTGRATEAATGGSSPRIMATWCDALPLRATRSRTSQTTGFPGPAPAATGSGSVQLTADTGPVMHFLGHSTVRVELAGRTVLTDPVLTPTVGPLRRVAPPLAPAAWAGVDLVLISHLHGDHLHLPSLRLLGGTRIVVPRGAGAWLRRKGCAHVEERAPGEVLTDGDLRVSGVHARPSGHRCGPRLTHARDTRAMGHLLEGTDGD